jgi:hypothetical protein
MNKKKLKKRLAALEERTAELEQQELARIHSGMQRVETDNPPRVWFEEASSISKQTWDSLEAKFGSKLHEEIALKYHAEAWERYPDEDELHQEQRAVFLRRMRYREAPMTSRGIAGVSTYEHQLAAERPKAEAKQEPEPKSKAEQALANLEAMAKGEGLPPGPLDDYRQPPFTLRRFAIGANPAMPEPHDFIKLDDGSYSFEGLAAGSGSFTHTFICRRGVFNYYATDDDIREFYKYAGGGPENL